MFQVSHLRRAGGVVHRVCDFSPVLAERGVAGDGRTGGHFSLDPGLEGFLFRDAACGFQPGDNGCGVVAFGIGEVFEIQGGFHGWIGAGQVQLAP